MTFDQARFTADMAALGKANPGLTRSFQGVHATALEGGVLPAATKELMALAVSVATGCEDCCGHHLDRARGLGSTDEEIAETLGVAVLMGGGPALTHAARVAATFAG